MCGLFFLTFTWGLEGSGVRKRAGGTFSPRPGLRRSGGRLPSSAPKEKAAQPAVFSFDIRGSRTGAEVNGVPGARQSRDPACAVLKDWPGGARRGRGLLNFGKALKTVKYLPDAFLCVKIFPSCVPPHRGRERKMQIMEERET